MKRDEIKKCIEGAIQKMGAVNAPNFSVEVPGEKSHGDYATNVALALSKQLKKNPLEVAKEIILHIGQQDFIEKIEVAGPGFINFYLAKEVFVENVKQILKDPKNFGSNKQLKGKKIVVEYTDPNPFKEFHIGHLMSNSIGEAISRLIQFGGATTKRANYQGDVGMHVAKAVWGKLKNPQESWQAGYVLGAAQYEADEAAKKEIQELNKKIYERSDKQINKLYDEGKKQSLKYFDGIYKTLGTEFDYFFFESQVADFGKEVVVDGLEKGIFETGEKGAVVFKGEKFGLHTRVFINSEGLPTYEAKELGLANIKYNTYRYDSSIIITGNEVNEYFKVLICAMGQIFPALAEKTSHIGHGMLRLPEGKMSSRSGKGVTFEFLLNEVKNKVMEKIADRGFSPSQQQEVSEIVAIGALKYSILRQGIGSDIIFDLEKSVSFEGDSGPYLQYSYVRAQSVVSKAKGEGIKASVKKVPNEISGLEKMMAQFPEVVEKAAEEYEPHIIATYLTELAREFNNYYAHNKIVDKEDEFSSYKVGLVEAFSIIMKNGLWLLGITAPKKM